ncbi:hypothetical protein OAF54_02185 [bacterium]|nr:hypothetical protein [bacterium]
MSKEMNTEVEETVDVVEQEESLDEASAGQATLNVSATKTQMLGDLMSKVAGMTKQDLSSFLDKTLAQVGKEADSVPDTSSKNSSSVSNSGAGVPSPRVAVPAKAMKEDLEDLFGDQEDLSEDFRTRATTIFEAAVNNRVQLEVVRIEEENEVKLEEQVTESIEELHGQVEKYMDYVVEKWMEENSIALENNFRVQATESFIDGLKNLFAENYVEVPEEKIDLVAELEERLGELEESLEVAEAKNVELTKVISEATADATFEAVSEGLVDTQVEKLRALAEGVEYSTPEEYAEKLKIIKEQYFTESKKENEGFTGLINEEVSVGSNDDVEDEAVVHPDMRPYMESIARTIRK